MERLKNTATTLVYKNSCAHRGQRLRVLVRRAEESGLREELRPELRLEAREQLPRLREALGQAPVQLRERALVVPRSAKMQQKVCSTEG